TGFQERDRFPAGTLRVPARQPRGRLALTLLQPETFLDARFSYDISAWSLPYAFGVEAHSASDLPDAGWVAVTPQTATTTTNASDGSAGAGGSAAAVGFLVEPGFDRWVPLIRFMKDDGRVIVLNEPFRTAGRQWP